MKELISIIVPVHNSSKYLSNCIESIINQTYKNIEIITIENGSTDNSLEILNKYKDKILIEVLKESGLSQARNKGLEISKGKYIAFIDSDDTIESNFIEELYNNLKENNSDMSICNFTEIYEETNKTILRNYYPQETISNNQIQNNLNKFNYAIWNKLYKKEILEKNNIKFPIGLKYEDIPFVLEYIIKCNKISKVNKYLYNYKIHKNSEQTTVDKRIFDIIEIMNNCLKKTNKEKLEDLYTSTLTTYALKMRYIKDDKLRKDFINKTYSELNINYPNWKKSNYIQTRNILKRIVEKNKILVKIYTKIYGIIH